MNRILSYIKAHQLQTVIASAVVGFGIGFLVFHKSPSEIRHDNATKQIYTCSMDPSVKQDHPGKCPICGMDLVPVNGTENVSDGSANGMGSDEIMLSDEAMALADVQTQVVTTGSTMKELRLFGKIQPDERMEQVQSAYVDGRVEKLLINAVGDRVEKGQTLAVIYSPVIYATEQELLQAMDYPVTGQRDALVESAIEKLKLLQIDKEEIDKIISSHKASPYVSLRANTSGTVIDKQVEQGDYVKQGQALLKIANLNTVWAVFQAYEGDLPFIRQGAVVVFTAESLPGKTFTGTVNFVDPVLDATSRTAGVRVVMKNPGGIFKPQMIVSGYCAANLDGYADDIVVPKSAVLWTGKRSVVYVKDEGYEQPTFMLREVTLGPSLPDSYIIIDGLAEGEEIVTNGAFAVDASAQLAGKRSMMNK